MEIKNKLTVTRGDAEIIGEGRGSIKSRNMYKGPMDTDNKGRRVECGRGVMDRAGESNGGKMETTLIKQQ